MTRSELLQIGINLLTAAIQEPSQENGYHGNANEDIRALNALGLELFLAEQKRSDGCDKCNDPKILEIQIETGFYYCPHCGRSLTEGESV